MERIAETPVGRDSLGTSWKFDVFPGKLGVVYAVTVGKERYRIAPDHIQKDKWRIDTAWMGHIWEPVNQEYYHTAKEAARDLVQLEQSGKLTSLMRLKFAWGNPLKV